MAQFEIYTYQFQRILKCSQTEIKFEGMPSVACTDEQWDNRQGFFGKIFDKYLVTKPTFTRLAKIFEV